MHSGTYALQVGPLATTDRAYVGFNPPTPVADAKIGTFVNFPQIPFANSYALLLRLSDANNLGEVDAVFGADANGNPYWGLRRPNGSQIPYDGILETVPATINLNTYYHIEIRRKVGIGNAVATLLVNGVEVLSNTSETIVAPATDCLYGIIYSDPIYTQPIFIDDNELTETALPITVSTTGPYTGVINQTINFNATISGGTPPYNYQIAWGDGTATGVLTSTGAVTASHAYANVGSYTIEIAVQLGGSTFTTVTITDGTPPPPDILLPLVIIAGSVVTVALVVSRKKGKGKRKK